MNEPQFVAVDMSAQVFGKYQHCFWLEGHWYSDQDEDWTSPTMRPKPGSVARAGFVYQGNAMVPTLIGLPIAEATAFAESAGLRLSEWTPPRVSFWRRLWRATFG